MTYVHSSHSMFVRMVVARDRFFGFEEEGIDKLHRELKNCRGRVVNISKRQCAFGLYTLDFHRIDHIVEDVKWFGSLEMLGGSNLRGIIYILKMHTLQSRKDFLWHNIYFGTAECWTK